MCGELSPNLSISLESSRSPRRGWASEGLVLFLLGVCAAMLAHVCGLFGRVDTSGEGSDWADICSSGLEVWFGSVVFICNFNCALGSVLQFVMALMMYSTWYSAILSGDSAAMAISTALAIRIHIASFSFSSARSLSCAFFIAFSIPAPLVPVALRVVSAMGGHEGLRYGVAPFAPACIILTTKSVRCRDLF